MNEREARYARFRAEHDQLAAALDDACAHEDDEAAVDAFWEAAQQGHFILCPDSCPRDGCQTGELNLGWPLNYFYARVRYGDESGHLQRAADYATQGQPCLCCHVAPGQWHHVGCLFEQCPYCSDCFTLVCKGEHRADIARERTPPDLAEYLSRPGTLAYLESLRAEPGMDPATMDMVIALARVFAPHQDDDAAHRLAPGWPPVRGMQGTRRAGERAGNEGVRTALRCSRAPGTGVSAGLLRVVI